MTPYERWQWDFYCDILPESFEENMPEEQTAEQEEFEKWVNAEANDFYTELEF